jgi:hypothetical protein
VEEARLPVFALDEPEAFVLAQSQYLTVHDGHLVG